MREIPYEVLKKARNSFSNSELADPADADDGHLLQQAAQGSGGPAESMVASTENCCNYVDKYPLMVRLTFKPDQPDDLEAIKTTTPPWEIIRCVLLTGYCFSAAGSYWDPSSGRFNKRCSLPDPKWKYRMLAILGMRQILRDILGKAMHAA
ncbi:hypothetical protein SELMODRAFT_408080 [Selaginella moellendorffii]|uniref:Uncharacterized protein n=1 Tax=Selaginella moellendorffii TaxID=88036 RepID=D8R747_SELML|nr:hypothetical protein SELMODRAFT_408080 [Selaginella moellendorffii]